MHARGSYCKQTETIHATTRILSGCEYRSTAHIMTLPLRCGTNFRNGLSCLHVT
jgi:hypothetical protein